MGSTAPLQPEIHTLRGHRGQIEVAERMRALAWWDWDHDRLFAALDDFRHMDAEEFIEKYH